MNHSRGALMAPISRKRKERDDFFMHPIQTNNSNNNSRGKKQLQPHPFLPNTTSLKKKPAEPAWSNRLLAGCLAHEFLTQGTLLGQKLDRDPARAEAEAVPPSTPADFEKKPAPALATSRLNGGSSAEPIATVQQQKTYADVSRLLKTDGAHIPGIVNPTQLARWIQM